MTPVVVGHLLYGCDGPVIEAMRKVLPVLSPTYAACAGIIHRGELVGGVLYHGHVPGVDVAVCVAVTTPAAAKLQMMREALAIAWDNLGVPRITLETARHNKAARRLAERIGFKVEGVRRRAFDGTRDLIVYGLMKDEVKI